MSRLQHKTMMPEEFLAWEATQELRWEFNGFRPVAMTGRTAAHSVIQGNIITTSNNRLRGKRRRPYGPDLKVEIGLKYRYPDAFVSCTPVGGASTVVTNPVVIFEVLSESTAEVDRTTKLREYRSLPSVQRYVMLEQKLGKAEDNSSMRLPSGGCAARSWRRCRSGAALPQLMGH